jgi:hypothetical protein
VSLAWSCTTASPASISRAPIAHQTALLVRIQYCQYSPRMVNSNFFFLFAAMESLALLNSSGPAMNSSPAEVDRQHASHSHGPRVSTPGISSGPRRQRSRSNLRRAHTVGTMGKKTGAPGEKRGPTSSSLRANGSSDRLRKPPEPPAGKESSAGGREGKHFTVGNVGNNGRIYLR